MAWNIDIKQEVISNVVSMLFKVDVNLDLIGQAVESYNFEYIYRGGIVPGKFRKILFSWEKDGNSLKATQDMLFIYSFVRKYKKELSSDLEENQIEDLWNSYKRRHNGKYPHSMINMTYIKK